MPESITILPGLPFEVKGICGIPIAPAMSSPQTIFWSERSDNPVLSRYLELLGVQATNPRQARTYGTYGTYGT